MSAALRCQGVAADQFRRHLPQGLALCLHGVGRMRSAKAWRLHAGRSTKATIRNWRASVAA